MFRKNLHKKRSPSKLVPGQVVCSLDNPAEKFSVDDQKLSLKVKEASKQEKLTNKKSPKITGEYVECSFHKLA